MLIQKVENFIREAHTGQTRWDGSDYFSTHLVGVRDIALTNVKFNSRNSSYLFAKSTLTEEKDRKILQIVTLSHDVAEDVERFKNKEELLVNLLFLLDKDKELEIEDWNDIKAALKSLNKNNYSSYLDFILGAKKTNFYSRLTKWSDISHNLRDLKNGSMRDKYLLSKYILEN